MANHIVYISLYMLHRFRRSAVFSFFLLGSSTIIFLTAMCMACERSLFSKVYEEVAEYREYGFNLFNVQTLFSLHRLIKTGRIDKRYTSSPEIREFEGAQSFTRNNLWTYEPLIMWAVSNKIWLKIQWDLRMHEYVCTLYNLSITWRLACPTTKDICKI
jgi:hypothetical protein